MKIVAHEIEIAAPAAKIWDLMWNAESYRDWTQFFGGSGVYESDWQVGGRTVFWDHERQNGMVATIESLNKPTEVIFKHIGLIENGEEFRQTKEVLEWSGAQERYFLTELDGYTKMTAEINTMPEHEQHMRDGLVKGFDRIKQLAEE